ncbi:MULTISPECIES: hypothetical protein [Providencia]|uniref:Uncharacterized protein n=2 Tax=Providencia TaxID=586 RepID=A0AA42FL98_9GAMM|nr:MULTISPECIES: hypothetical protein [Providencia]EJD6410102.1 hypothetical protein [Providencia rettgeri]EJD6662612.1 hypothetical protein [Providencia rettgeri]ELR5080004.1 hypothetical protein [Providencia rettgeri]ELR5094039.1 hypothetical protein [Providencia rettgeri]ELR5174366.1 hypothetical protein [Providencia rettgeri]
MNLYSVSPFASYITLQKNSKSTTTKKSITDLIGDINKAIKEYGINIVSHIDIKPKPTANVKETAAFHLTEDRSVSWAGTNLINDSINHLLTYFVDTEFSVIYVSDSGIKSAIISFLSTGRINGWSMVDEMILTHAFIEGNELKTLWLGGTHRNVSIKPNSKIISGSNLNDAIDPFGDSTYIAGAVRSSVAGVSLKRSGVWFGPKKDWDSFAKTAQNLLAKLHDSKLFVEKLPKNSLVTVHHGLAQNIYDLTSVSSAYQIEFADIETLKGKRRKDKLTYLINNYQIDIDQTNTSINKEEIYVLVKKIIDNSFCWLTISPEIVNKKLILKFVAPIPKEFNEFVDSIRSNIDFIRIFYDSGHTISNASLSYSEVQDREFDIEFKKFSTPTMTYEIKKEKPVGNPPPIEHIFTETDNSLFKWVFKEGLTQLGLSQPAKDFCWLYCDDRSGEIADFIHVDRTSQTKPKITLIHVKGANSDSDSRQVSPGAYELVIAQAMKNLRRMSSVTMFEAIKSNVSRHGDKRVWDKPWAKGLISPITASQDLLLALNSIKSNCSYEVIVVQPHALKSRYLNSQQKQSSSTGAKQLRSLLFGAKAMANSASATFRVIADDR